MKQFIDKLIERLEEEKEYCSYNPKIRDEAINNAISIVNQIAEEHKDDIQTIDVSELLGESVNDGWIPCSERLPDKRDWYLAVFQEVNTGFTGIPFIADYLMGTHTEYTTEDGWIIAHCTDTRDSRAEYYKQLKCIAWKPIAPYQPKGE